MNSLEEVTQKPPHEDDNQDDPYLVNALVRGLEVLRCFTADRATLSLTDLATLLGWSRTAPFRLVYTLQKLGYLQQEPFSKRYRLTAKVLELGFDYLHSLQLPEIARPYLEQLRDETGASSHLGLLDGFEVVYVVRVQTRLALASNVGVGSRLPAHATAMGKVLLAYQPPVVIESLLNSGLKLAAYTDYTITDLQKLRDELASIRANGLAISDGQFELGIHSIAAPIRDLNGNVVAAINISAPILNGSIPSESHAHLVRQTALDISGWLGYREKA